VSLNVSLLFERHVVFLSNQLMLASSGEDDEMQI